MIETTYMRCLSPGCDGESRVLWAKSIKEGMGIRRNRECTVCQARLTTYELFIFQGCRSGEVAPLEAYTIRVLISNQYLRQYEYRMKEVEIPEKEAIEIESTIQAYWKILNLNEEQQAVMEGLCRDWAKSIIEKRVFQDLDAELDVRQEKRREEKKPKRKKGGGR